MSHLAGFASTSVVFAVRPARLFVSGSVDNTEVEFVVVVVSLCDALPRLALASNLGDLKWKKFWDLLGANVTKVRIQDAKDSSGV